MDKKLVLLLTAILLTGTIGMDIPAMAVTGPFGYDLQKDMHRSENKNKNDADKQAEAQRQAEQKKAELEKQAQEEQYVDVSEAEIFPSSVDFNKVYYTNPTIKSAVSKYKNANYTGALQELYSFVKKYPNNAQAYYYIGMAYTKIGNVDAAKAAYQKCINMKPDKVLADYARRGRDCLNGEVSCTVSNVQVNDIEIKDDLDKFIAAPYGNGLSPEMNKKYKQQQLDALQNKINNGQSLSPEDIKRLKEMNKSEALTSDKLAMADTEKKNIPSNDEVLGALDVLKRAGLNISADTAVQEAKQNVYVPDPQIQQMSMMLNGGNNNNYDPMMNMLPYMMQGEGKNVDPQVIQAMMMNSMMNSINGMNNSNNN